MCFHFLVLSFFVVRANNCCLFTAKIFAIKNKARFVVATKKKTTISPSFCPGEKIENLSFEEESKALEKAPRLVNHFYNSLVQLGHVCLFVFAPFKFSICFEKTITHRSRAVQPPFVDRRV
jgi:hypothetical protein